MPATITVTQNAAAISDLALVTSTLTIRRPKSEYLLKVADTDGSFTFAFDDEIIVTIDGVKVFTGLVREINIRQGNLARDGVMRYVELRAFDLSWRAAHPAALVEKDYDGDSDRTIIQDLVTEAGLGAEISAPAGKVAEIDTDVKISFGPDATFAEAMDKLCEYTDAVWYIDEEKEIVYNVAASFGPHDWSIDQESPDGSTTQRVAINSYTQRWPTPASDVTVYGADDPFGIPYEASASTALSKTYAHTIQDPLIATQEQAQAVAGTAVDSLSVSPQEIRFTYHYDAAEGTDDIPFPLERIVVTSAVHGLTTESFTIEQVQIKTDRTPDPVIQVTAATNRQLALAEFLKKLRARRVRQKGTYFGYDFTGPDQEYVQIPSVAALESLTNMTISAWVKMDALPTGTSGCIAWKDDNTAGGWRFEITSTGKLRLIRDHSISDVNAQGATTLDTARVYHLAATLDGVSGTIGKVYINGEVDATDNGSGSVQSDVGIEINVGYNADADANGLPSLPLDGWVSDLRIWDDVLPPNMIRRIAAKPGAEPDLYSGNLVGYWRMNEYDDGESVAGTETMKDSSSQANHGSTAGAAPFPVGRREIV